MTEASSVLSRSSLVPKGRAGHRMRQRESGFDLDCVQHSKINEYNALTDPNMRHFFENRRVQRHLYNTGQIDEHGRIIDLERAQSKLHIIEQEFSHAEQLEQVRARDELEMRYRVQRKRYEALEHARREEKLKQIKEDRQLCREITTAIFGRDEIQYPPLKTSSNVRSRGATSGRRKRRTRKSSRSGAAGGASGGDV